MTEDLDKIDYQILKLLQENSNITNLSLSKRIGLLSSTVGSEAWNSRDLKSRPH